MRLLTVFGFLVLVALAAVPTLAADLVSVSAQTTFPTANPGGADEGTCTISNNTSGDVRARLDVSVVYSDGTVQRLTGISDPGVLGPGGGYQLNVFFVVPSTASLGTAQFVCDVRAQAKNLKEQETQSAPFDVVP